MSSGTLAGPNGLEELMGGLPQGTGTCSCPHIVAETLTALLLHILDPDSSPSSSPFPPLPPKAGPPRRQTRQAGLHLSRSPQRPPYRVKSQSHVIEERTRVLNLAWLPSRLPSRAPALRWADPPFFRIAARGEAKTR